LNCQKQSLKGESGTKSLVKATWSEKLTVLSTFLESSLNFQTNNTLQNLLQSGRKAVSKFEQEQSKGVKKVVINYSERATIIELGIHKLLFYFKVK